MKTKIALIFCCYLLAGCDNDSSPTSANSGPPGIGSTYDVAESFISGSSTIYDTMHIVVDDINLRQDGRDSVSRLIRWQDGHLFDTEYIHYLPSGEIEEENTRQDIPGWTFYPFTFKHSISILHDTLINGKPYRDTTNATGSGATVLSFAGKSFSAQTVVYSVKGFEDGDYVISSGTASYVPSVGYIVKNSVLLEVSGEQKTSEFTVIAYNLK